MQGNSDRWAWVGGSGGNGISRGSLISRRDLFCRIGGGFGALGLASVLADAGLLVATRAAEASVTGKLEASVPSDPLAPKIPHFPAKAKRVIFLFMNGGPSHVDTFDPKPALEKHAGQDPPAGLTTGRRKRGKIMPSPFTAEPRGQSGIAVGNTAFA